MNTNNYRILDNKNDMKKSLYSISSLRTIKSMSQLGWVLFQREMKISFRDALLGVLWLAVPSIMAIVAAFLAENSSYISFNNLNVPVPIFMVTSMTLWASFSDALIGPQKAVEKAAKILLRVPFQVESYLVQSFLEILFNSGLRALAAFVFLWFYDFSFSSWMLLNGCVLVSLVMGFGIGFFLIIPTMFYSDVKKMLPSFINGALVLSPVIYPFADEAMLKPLYNLNPIVPLMGLMRNKVLGFQDFEPLAFGIWFIICVFLCFWGLAFFRSLFSIVFERNSPA